MCVNKEITLKLVLVELFLLNKAILYSTKQVFLAPHNKIAKKTILITLFEQVLC
jgi:hypothetical protein